MFRIMQTAVALAITLILVNYSQAGKPGTSSGNGSSHVKTTPTQGVTNPPAGVVNNKTTLPYLPQPFHNPTANAPVNKTNLPILPQPFHNPVTKNPVHGQGSSHDPRSPSKTHGCDYRNWDHHCFNSRYGCETYWSLADDCYFYFYAPANCYYPVAFIELFPPVRTPVVVAPAVPVLVVPVAAR